MKNKKEILEKVKKLIIYSERLATDKPDYTQKFIDQIKVIELCNELKVLLNQPYKIESRWKQLKIDYAQENEE